MIDATIMDKLLIPVKSLDLGLGPIHTREVVEILSRRGINYFAQLLAFQKSEFKSFNRFGPITIRSLSNVIQQHEFEVGVFHHFQSSLVPDISIAMPITTPDRLQGVIESDPILVTFLESLQKPVDPANKKTGEQTEQWLLDLLPDSLKAGLSPDFLRAVLASEHVRADVRKVLETSIASHLGMDWM